MAFEVSAIFDFVKPIKSFETLENFWFSVVLRAIQNFGHTEREMARSPSPNTHLRTPQSLALTTEFCCNALSRSCSFWMKLIIAKLSQRIWYIHIKKYNMIFFIWERNQFNILLNELNFKTIFIDKLMNL